MSDRLSQNKGVPAQNSSPSQTRTSVPFDAAQDFQGLGERVNLPGLTNGESYLHIRSTGNTLLDLPSANSSLYGNRDSLYSSLHIDKFSFSHDASQSNSSSIGPTLTSAKTLSPDFLFSQKLEDIPSLILPSPTEMAMTRLFDQLGIARGGVVGIAPEGKPAQIEFWARGYDGSVHQVPISNGTIQYSLQNSEFLGDVSRKLLGDRGAFDDITASYDGRRLTVTPYATLGSESLHARLGTGISQFLENPVSKIAQDQSYTHVGQTLLGFNNEPFVTFDQWQRPSSGSIFSEFRFLSDTSSLGTIGGNLFILTVPGDYNMVGLNLSQHIATKTQKIDRSLGAGYGQYFAENKPGETQPIEVAGLQFNSERAGKDSAFKFHATGGLMRDPNHHYGQNTDSWGFTFGLEGSSSKGIFGLLPFAR